VAKPELGTKRLCGNCGAKFYDLSKTPIVCPNCDTVFEVAPVPTRSRPDSAAARAAAAAAAAKEDAVVPETPDAEFVSLEEADSENKSAKAPAADGAGADDEDIELDDENMDDAAFIEEEEEGEDDVTDIIGDVEDEEET